MNRKIPARAWVQIESVVLRPEERAPNVPEETRECPLLLWVKGFLKEEALPGDTVEIETIIGRALSGKLLEENPPYEHDFGRPITELLTVKEEFRRIPAKGGASQ
ncbi:MAG TPA: 2-amino-4-oxopentanoate thiolase subunit OrtA [Synergistaceae bacterium]|nr:2-amino-4-oxopentanoate thiolase subunit OrtA [Synergistaceae bacterium]